MRGIGGEVLGPIHALWTSGAAGGLDDATLLGRYASRRDGPAFEAIVVRHGPMVRAVCRSLAADPHEADDLFQATFLVLAKRAGSIRKLESLGPWLHGVVRRVAAEARSGRKASGMGLDGIELVAPMSAASEVDAPAIHEEVGRLPRKYRDPIILCYLEGLTHDEAASRLGWPVGTVRGRLSRARDMLRPRLTKRGLATAAILLATGSNKVRAAVPRFLLETTTRSATAMCAAESATTGAMFLSQGVLHAMFLTKLKFAAGLVGASLAVAGAGAMARPARMEGPGDGPQAPTAPAAPAPPAAEVAAPDEPEAPPRVAPPAPPEPPAVVEQDDDPRKSKRDRPSAEELLSSVQEFREKQLLQVEESIEALNQNIESSTEEVNQAQRALDAQKSALKSMVALRDDLRGKGDLDGDGKADIQFDFNVNGQNQGRAKKPTAPARTRPDRVPAPRADAPRARPRRNTDVAPPRPEPKPRPQLKSDDAKEFDIEIEAAAADSDRITALEQKLDQLIEMMGRKAGGEGQP